MFHDSLRATFGASPQCRAFPCLTGLRPPFGQMVRQYRLTPPRTPCKHGDPLAGTPVSLRLRHQLELKLLAGDEVGERLAGRSRFQASRSAFE